MGYRRMEVWDGMELFGIEQNNHLMYCCMTLDGDVDVERMEASARRLISAYPILGSAFVSGFFRGRWQSNMAIQAPLVDEVPIEQINQLSSLINIDTPGQFKILIHRSLETKVVIAMNHMVCDAQGFKEVLYRLVAIYNDLTEGRQPVYKVDRRPRHLAGLFWSVFHQSEGLTNKLKVLFRFQNHKDYSQQILEKVNQEKTSYIEFLDIETETFNQVKNYCKLKGITINDFIMGAYGVCLSTYVGKDITIPCMVDVRRFAYDPNKLGLANYVSTIPIHIRLPENKDLVQICKQVHKATRGGLKDFRTFDGYMYLAGLFRMMPFKPLKGLMQESFKSFPIAFSNLGILDQGQLVFKGADLTQCYMTGSIKEEPCFWLAISTYNQVLTMTINLRSGSTNRTMVKDFLKRMKNIISKEVEGY